MAMTSQAGNVALMEVRVALDAIALIAKHVEGMPQGKGLVDKLVALVPDTTGGDLAAFKAALTTGQNSHGATPRS